MDTPTFVPQLINQERSGCRVTLADELKVIRDATRLLFTLQYIWTIYGEWQILFQFYNVPQNKNLKLAKYILNWDLSISPPWIFYCSHAENLAEVRLEHNIAEPYSLVWET